MLQEKTEILNYPVRNRMSLTKFMTLDVKLLF